MPKQRARQRVRVFISHNQREKSWVRRLVAELRALGLSVFFDEDSIQPGENFVRAIDRGIKESEHVILILSRAALESHWVALESAMAVLQDPAGRNRKVIPVMIEPLSFHDLPLSIQALRIVDLTDGALRDQQYHHFLRSLGITTANLPSPPDLTVELLPAGTHTHERKLQNNSQLADATSEKRTTVILGLGLLSLMIIVIVIILNAQLVPPRESSIAYVMDVSGSVRHPQPGGQVPYSEFTDNLLLSIDAIAQSAAEFRQRHQVLQLGEGLIQGVVCQTTFSPSSPIRHLRAIRQFLTSCRTGLKRTSTSSGTQIDVALNYAAVLTNPQDETNDVIIMFTDFLDNAEFEPTISKPNLANVCIIVFYMFPTTIGSSAAMNSLVSSWDTRLKTWGARDVRLWHVAAFDERHVSEFVTKCIAAAPEAASVPERQRR